MSSPISYDLQGQGGGIVLSGGGVTTAENVRWIQCLTDCVFVSLDCENIPNITNIAGVVIPAGVGIGGSNIDVELASGVAIAYYT